MKLNLEYYKKEYEKKEHIEEKDEIIKRIDNCKGTDFSKTLDSHAKIKNILALSEIRENILNWYTFKDNAKILELNANFGELTGFLCRKAYKVVSIESSKEKSEIIEKRHKDKENLELIVGNFKQINIQSKFDYVVIMGIVDDLKQTLEYAKQHLTEDGTILLAVNNKFGVKAWITTKEEAKVVNNTNFTISKRDLEGLLDGLKYKFYYPLPDYKMPNIIYTDKCMPNIQNIYRDVTYKDENVNFKEVDAYYEIIKNNPEDFKYFANSFLVEISNNIVDNNIRFITFSNMRKDEYRIKTIVKEKEVYKTNVNEKSKKHINAVKENIQILQRLGIRILDTFDNDTIISKYTEETTLEDRLIDVYKQQGEEEFLGKIIEYREFLKEKLQITGNIEKNIFTKYNIECDNNKLKKLSFVKYGFWDLIFQNCFVINNEYFFYDQEWFEENVPIEYILYRAIVYFHESKKYISDDKIFDKIDIVEFIDLFRELDDKIQIKIRKQLMWNIHTKEELENNKYRRKKQQLIEKDKEIVDLKNQINILENQNTQKDSQIKYMEKSLSWKITKPLRVIRSVTTKNTKLNL